MLFHIICLLRVQERFEAGVSDLVVEETLDSRSMGRAETDSFLYEFAPKLPGKYISIIAMRACISCRYNIYQKRAINISAFNEMISSTLVT